MEKSMSNLNLPICPKCNETKYITEEQCVKMLINLVTFRCQECKISWDGYKHEKEITSWQYFLRLLKNISKTKCKSIE